MTNVRSLANLAAYYPLCFENTELQVLDLDGHIWLTAADLSRGLGYARADEVARIYRRNKDEFSEDMTALIGLQTNESAEAANLAFSDNLQTQTRIFSARGCHLVAMLARTEKAKAFRKWVLDVLEGLATQSAPQKTYLPNADHLSLRDTMMHPDAFEQIFTVASAMLHGEDTSEWQRGFNKKVDIEAARRVEEVQLDTVLGLRILTESDGIGGMTTKILPHDANLLRDKDLADYIRSADGPVLRLLPDIIHACTERLNELYQLPLRGLRAEHGYEE